jgi:mono/diheme cytochrome c family protein
MRRTHLRRAALAACAFAALLAGCARDDASLATASTHVDRADVASTAGIGDAEAGKEIFATNCGTCHGTTGEEGGVGPSLRGENQRKNYDQTIVWIKDPAPPMPKLYPKFLSETEVDDVAAYVQKL